MARSTPEFGLQRENYLYCFFFTVILSILLGGSPRHSEALSLSPDIFRAWGSNRRHLRLSFCCFFSNAAMLAGSAGQGEIDTPKVAASSLMDP